jgi:redox-sensitive bicupin YhaK (pirin superfamily)
MWVDVRRSSSRFVSRTDRVESRHSFSFGPHYDPDNTRFGALVAHNEDVLLHGGGFDAHPHQGIDIVSWVLSGALRHHDDAG